MAARPEARTRAHSALAAAAVAVCALALGFGLKRYYAVPKQSFRAAIASFTAQAKPGDALVAVYQADRGFDYYTRRLGLANDGRFYSTRTVAGFDSRATTDAMAGGETIIVTGRKATRMPRLMRRYQNQATRTGEPATPS